MVLATLGHDRRREIQSKDQKRGKFSSGIGASISSIFTRLGHLSETRFRKIPSFQSRQTEIRSQVSIVYPDSARIRRPPLPNGAIRISTERMIRPGFLDIELRQNLIELARNEGAALSSGPTCERAGVARRWDELRGDCEGRIVVKRNRFDRWLRSRQGAVSCQRGRKRRIPSCGRWKWPPPSRSHCSPHTDQELRPFRAIGHHADTIRMTEMMVRCNIDFVRTRRGGPPGASLRGDR